MADDSDIVTFKIPHSDGQNEDDRSQDRDSLETVSVRRNVRRRGKANVPLRKTYV